MKKFNIPFDLQFFADGEETGEIESNAGSQEEVIDGEESTVETETDAEEQTPPPDENAVFANMRRRAENEVKARYDNQIKEMFGNLAHPTTGKPITSLDEYRDAVYAQQRLTIEQQAASGGLKAEDIDRYIQNNPVMRQAQDVIAQAQTTEAERRMNEDIAKISQIDETVKTADDLSKNAHFSDILGMVRRGMSVYEAYKLANFEELIQRKESGAKQAAINQAKGKSHLSATDSLSNPDTIDIPEAEMKQYREAFPDKTVAEIKALYSKVQ